MSSIFDSLPEPPKIDYKIDWSKEDIDKLAKDFEEAEITPEEEAQLQREIDLGLHPGNR